MSIENPSFELIDYSLFGNEIKDESGDFQKFISDQQAKNTKYNTNFAMNRFNKFCSEIKETRRIEELLLCKADLNTILSKFYMTALKRDGDEYEPDSLTTLQRGIQRYLDDNNLLVNIIEDKEFEQSRKVLSAKRKLLTKQGKGGKPNATREVEQFEIDKLYDEGFFGRGNPLSLQRTMWWNLSLHFGFRARDESRKLRWGDVVVEKDPVKGECLVLIKERGSKTRQGKENEEKRFYNPCVYAIEGDRCPVDLYKEFKERRPSEALKDEAPFYLSLRRKVVFQKEKIWFMSSPLGKNKIGEFMREHGLDGVKKVANHSVRKTGIGKLLDAEVPEVFVAQHSGHKNIDSLRSYKSASKNQRHKMSNILSNTENHNTSTTSTITTESRINSIFSGGTFNGCTFNFATESPTKKLKI
eukprot:TCONS_00035468-protein